MKSQNNKLKEQEWQHLAKIWKDYQAPFKPDKERIELYKGWIKKYALGKRLLLLGATPEIRDLFAALRLEVTLVDFSPAMVRAMTSLRKSKSRETIVIGNWLQMGFKDKFDLVLGDFSVSNIKQGNLSLFFQRVARSLKEKGVFICGGWGKFYPGRIPISAQRMINKLRANPQYYHSFYNLCHDHYAYWQNRWARHVEDSLILDTKFEQFYQKGKISQKELNVLKLNLDWYGTITSPRIMRKTTKRYFCIKAVFQQISHPVYNKFYRYYILEKK